MVGTNQSNTNEPIKSKREPYKKSSTAQSKPLVFISHDSRDSDLAEEFGNLLSDVSGGTIKSFRSSDRKGTTGIEFGAVWFDAIMTKLSDSTDFVAILTPNSINRPWLLYEAGLAKGKIGIIVFGLAIGISLEKVSIGPFSQLQNCSNEEDQITKLVMQIISRNPDASPREEAVRNYVKIFQQRVNTILKERSLIAVDEKVDFIEVDNHVSEQDFLVGMKLLIKKIKTGYSPDYILIISSGGALVGGILSKHLNVPMLVVTRENPENQETKPQNSGDIAFPEALIKGKKILLVDDIIRAGTTLKYYYEKTRQCNPLAIKSAVLLLAGEHLLIEPEFFVYQAQKINIRMFYDINSDFWQC